MAVAMVIALSPASTSASAIGLKAADAEAADAMDAVEVEVDAGTEAEVEAEIEQVMDADAEEQAQTQTEVETETETETETDANADSELETETESDTEMEAESESETETETESESESESESELDVEADADAAEEMAEELAHSMAAGEDDGPSFIPPPDEDLFISPDKQALNTYRDWQQFKVGAVVFKINPKRKAVVVDYKVGWPLRKFGAFRNEFVKAYPTQPRWVLMWYGTKPEKAKAALLSWAPDTADEWEAVVYDEAGKALRAMFADATRLTATQPEDFTEAAVKKL